MAKQQSIKLLTVDDRTVTTDLDRAGYKNMGVIVKLVKNFQETEEALKAEPIDLLVINHDYSKVDGLAICRHLKKLDAYKEVPIVITSVQTSAATREAALEAGADLFVEQPIPRQYFIEKVKRLLAQRTRNNDRVAHHGTAMLHYEGEACSVPIGDLSASGVLISTNLELRQGLEVEMKFVIPGYKKPIHAKGEVVRILKPKEINGQDGNGGIGIRFKEFFGDSEKRLDRYVAKSTDEQHGMLYYL